MRTLIVMTVAAAVGFGLLTPAALAVGTSYWKHSSESDFQSGSMQDVVATNHGDLKLSRAVRTLLGLDPRVSAVYALTQVADGTIYAATGPEGILLQIRDDQVTSAAELGESTNLVSLLTDSQGRLLIGTAGERGRIYRIDHPDAEPQVVFEADDAQYVWAMLETPDGLLYAATGPNGRLYEVGRDREPRVVLDSDENNLLCITGDGQDHLYVGTDPNGLVYRVNRRTGDAFVMYDAPETEVSALARDAAGNVYAATAQATESGFEPPDVGPPVGRPETAMPGAPIPSERPPAPAPPELPDPAPGEPLPIPRDPQPQLSLAEVPPDEAPPPPGDFPADHEPGARVPVRAPGQPVGAVTVEPAPGGNAIYRIDPDGFVTEIFRQPVVVYSIVDTDSSLLVATGAEGLVFHIDPSREETVVVAKVDSRDVLSLLPARDGRVLLGLANSGQIGAMTQGFATEGLFISSVLDAGQISRFGNIRLRGTLPEGTSLKVSTRSGNVAASSDRGWSAWSDEVSATEFIPIQSPSARFLQYRLRFSTTDGTQTPRVEEIEVAYQLPNLPPQITSVAVTPGEPSRHSGVASPETQKYAIEWEASDPNDDALVYSLWFRSGSQAPWILMQDNLRATSHEWETRTVADGVYQIRVEASDALANPPGAGRTASRVSEPVLVDNTPPVIGDVRVQTEGRAVTVEMKVVDRIGTVAAAGYAVNSATDWQTVLPSDNIADSPEEAYRFTVSGLSPGPNQITLRALDRRGNAAFHTINVNIGR